MQTVIAEQYIAKRHKPVRIVHDASLVRTVRNDSVHRLGAGPRPRQGSSTSALAAGTLVYTLENSPEALSTVARPTRRTFQIARPAHDTHERRRGVVLARTWTAPLDVFAPIASRRGLSIAGAILGIACLMAALPVIIAAHARPDLSLLSLPYDGVIQGRRAAA